MIEYFCRFRNYFLLTTVIVFTGLTLTTQEVSAASRSRGDLVGRLDRMHGLFSDRMYYMDSAIPVQLLADAKAIVFVRQFKAGFIFGVKGGYAISMLHDGKGNWSAPCFHSLGGGSIGLQFGGHQVDAIYLLMTREATRMLTGESSELGVDFAAIAGPVGRHKDVSTLTESPVLVYTDVTGLYAGATIQGGLISPSRLANETFYAKSDVSALDILEGRVEMPREAKPLIKELKKYVLEGLR